MMSNRPSVNFSNYAKGLYGKSLVTGLPEIIQSHSWITRILRTCVFVACVGGFIYQSLQFMNMYWDYSTVLDIQINAVTETIMPAITVCHPAGIKISQYCKSYPCKGFKKSEVRAFCFCYEKGRFCKNFKLRDGVQVPIDNNNMRRLARLPQSEIKHMFIKADEFIRHCSVFQPPDTVPRKCAPAVLSPSCTNSLPQATTCYTMNSLVGQPYRVPERITPSTVINIHLAYPMWEVDIDLFSFEAYFSLHSPYKLSNPFSEGIQVRRRDFASIFVSQTVKKLLKAPYNTDCYDYMADWKKNGGTGPTNRLDCIETCRMDYFREKFNCQSYSIGYPHEEARCPPQDCFIKMTCLYKDLPENTTYGSEYEDMVTSCSKKCKRACWQLDYKINVERKYLVRKVGREYVNRDPVMNDTNMTVSFQRMDETVYTYKAKYDPVETFSYIGGYVGIWLGVSLVALFDFLETTFILLRYPLMRFRLAKQRRRLRQALA